MSLDEEGRHRQQEPLPWYRRPRRGGMPSAYGLTVFVLGTFAFVGLGIDAASQGNLLAIVWFALAPVAVAWAVLNYTRPERQRPPR